MSSAICFNLDQPKILSSGNGLSCPFQNTGCIGTKRRVSVGGGGGGGGGRGGHWSIINRLKAIGVSLIAILTGLMSLTTKNCFDSAYVG